MTISTARWLGRRLSSGAFDAEVGRLICFAGALSVLVLGFWKIGDVATTEAALVLGVLLLLAVALGCVILGQLLWLSHQVKRLQDESPPRQRR
ncbi:MAG: hypothetical protein D6696_10535 [Acidobacteria bacterium]|nr:MAG: hypothetical protein D6696_10535 [Acidobacteriota bacterium]